ncbi:Isoleucyl-tRNA synthetase [Mycoplasma haemocanis str. Illinois]|uniref:Isoleucine--tRNA ligase n=1 Tax=Mycoplasma haemocanis (strain Illinois) TaxID=1111676 RepID=H6N5U2_MYCHN|nr:Isoleucyl-tRNA synthetase [Mycoplasma haemocanis str. Illinois]
MSFKNTLNIPSTKFPMRANLVENSSKYRDFWNSNQIFWKLSNREGETFTLHDGPPYANGNIHLGHALNKLLKDFVLRYKALKGYKINYIPGWDTHGLPIENRLEKQEGSNYKNKDSLEKRRACAEYAKAQIEIQKSQFENLHLLCDFKKIYKTMDPNFINQELNILYEFLQKDLLYWDLKPVAWSWSSKTALAESEIIYKEVESPSIYLGFSVLDNPKLPKNTCLLVWTTTPYTLEANQFVALHPDFNYILIEGNKKRYLISKKRFHDLKNDIGLRDFTIKEEFIGSELSGLKYRNPLNGREGTTICADYITEDAGTGIVHIAPAFGLEDYLAAGKINIYCPINEDGKFQLDTYFKPISGLFYIDANPIVINFLEESGSLLKSEKITHSIGHDWRTEKPLLYRASPQWFVNIKKLSSDVESISFTSSPEWISSHLKKLISAREEWCLSRQRCWGIPIVILFHDRKPILDLEQINHTIDLLKEHGIESWFEKEASFFLHPKFKNLKDVEKGQDILDVWFDSGCSWSILENKKADLYLEGFDQLRGWFNSSSVISLTSQQELPFKNIIAHGFALDGNGNKMSKSKGNVIDPIEIANKYGIDILRLWIAMNNYLEDIKLSESSLESAISTYRKIRNTLFRYSLSVTENLSFDPSILASLEDPKNRYIYSLFMESYKKINEYLERFHFFRAIKEMMDFLNIYSSWYLEISKDLLYCGSKEDREFKETQHIIYDILIKSIKLLSIFIPQTAEEAYSYIKGGSVALESLDPVEERLDIPVYIWSKFFELKDEIYSHLEDLKNQKVITGTHEAKVVINKDSLKGLESLNLKKYLNIAELEVGEELKVSKSSLPKCARCKRHENISGEVCTRCLQLI